MEILRIIIKIELIKYFENQNTISKIGEIDMDVIKSKSIDSLYYKFPLIERLVLEIYKLIPNSDIEIYSQGTMRTINSIIKNNEQKFAMEPKLKMLINKYFDEMDSSIRNYLFHPLKEDRVLKINFCEINEIIAKLLKLLNDVIENKI